MGVQARQTRERTRHDFEPGDREVGNIWDVIEGLYHILSDYAKDFDCYAIAQDLIYFEDGHMYVDWGREDFWDIVNRHDLSGVLENSDGREA